MICSFFGHKWRQPAYDEIEIIWKASYEVFHDDFGTAYFETNCKRCGVLANKTQNLGYWERIVSSNVLENEHNKVHRGKRK